MSSIWFPLDMRAKMDFFTFFINKGMLNPKNAGTIFSNNSFILHFKFQNGRHFNHISYDFQLFTSLLQLFGITYSWILHSK